jgi:hypothetical protein
LGKTGKTFQFFQISLDFTVFSGKNWKNFFRWTFSVFPTLLCNPNLPLSHTPHPYPSQALEYIKGRYLANTISLAPAVFERTTVAKQQNRLSLNFCLVFCVRYFQK